MPIQPDAMQPSTAARRDFLRTASALAASLTLAPELLAATVPGEVWYGTWGTALTGPAPASAALAFSNQTLRLIVHASMGGSRVRVRLSNEMGNTALAIGSAWLGLSASAATVAAGSNRQLSFGGRANATIAAGASLLSDPLDMTVPAQANLALSLYLPGSVQARTVHDAACQTSYVSTSGDQAASQSLRVQRNLYSWPFLAEVDIGRTAAGATLVALGDSQTDGLRSTGSANRRWPDYLARRLQAAALPGSVPVGVVNRGISGNRLLGDSDSAPLAGRDALERFDRDVLATSGVRYLVVLIGINDIITASSSSLPALADAITAGHARLVNRAHAAGIRVLGGTLLPFEGYTWYAPARDAVRQRVNGWIRNSGVVDAVADFDAAVRDPARPTRMRTDLADRDGLHPNDAGYEAMARTVPLGALT